VKSRVQQITRRQQRKSLESSRAISRMRHRQQNS
jgi:hypothetical protein